MTKLFIPLTKVDSAKRLVYARFDETPDRAGEIFDYASSKVEIQKWSDEIQKASGGKSFGNIRAMHQVTVAAGKLTDIAYDDDAKAVEFCAHIVDDDEWRKVETGVYTGFSPGGKYLRKWADGRYTRYTAAMREISLVDVPAMTTATFTLIKADGAEEIRPFQVIGDDDLAKFTDAFAAADGMPALRKLLIATPAPLLIRAFPSGLEGDTLEKRYWSGDLRIESAQKGEALPDGTFPIEAPADLVPAIEALDLACDKDLAKAHITRRATELQATDALPGDWQGSTRPAPEITALGTLAKGMESVACLARILQDIRWLQQSAEFESAIEGDASELPGKIKAWLAAGGDLLVQAVGEEVAEAKSGETADMALAARPGDLAKIFRLSTDRAAALDKVAAGAAELAKAMGERDTLAKRLAELEAQPAGGGPVLRTVDKGAEIIQSATPDPLDDEIAKALALPDGDQKALAMIKLQVRHQRPITL